MNPPATRDLWLEYTNKGLCGLCGNSGIIDTRGRAVSAAGCDAGARFWCLCPNGRALKEHYKQWSRPW